MAEIVNTPRPNGPPLNALRAFEAAARTGSFTAAGKELSVTSGAIAQQIKVLEAWTGAPLFERRAQGVSLSPLGIKVRPRFVAAFDSLAEAVQGLYVAANPKRVRIAALPAVAQLWLSSLLPKIRKIDPAIAVSITALETLPNLEREPYDIALFFHEEPLGSNVTFLAKDCIFPVASPDLAASIRNIEDLRDQTLLRDSAWFGDWEIWLVDHYPNVELDAVTSEFSLYSLAVEEARNGAGILLGHEILIRSALASGELVRLFDQKTTLERSLTVSQSSTSLENEAVNYVVKHLIAAASA
jgi:LysR family glycine cleavage system transcriptional activator